MRFFYNSSLERQTEREQVLLKIPVDLETVRNVGGVWAGLPAVFAMQPAGVGQALLACGFRQDENTVDSRSQLYFEISRTNKPLSTT